MLRPARSRSGLADLPFLWAANLPMTQEEGSSISLIILLPLRASSGLVLILLATPVTGSWTLTAPLRWQAAPLAEKAVSQVALAAPCREPVYSPARQP